MDLFDLGKKLYTYNLQDIFQTYICTFLRLIFQNVSKHIILYLHFFLDFSHMRNENSKLFCRYIVFYEQMKQNLYVYLNLGKETKILNRKLITDLIRY